MTPPKLGDMSAAVEWLHLHGKPINSAAILRVMAIKLVKGGTNDK